MTVSTVSSPGSGASFSSRISRVRSTCRNRTARTDGCRFCTPGWRNRSSALLLRGTIQDHSSLEFPPTGRSSDFDALHCGLIWGRRDRMHDSYRTRRPGFVDAAVCNKGASVGMSSRNSKDTHNCRARRAIASVPRASYSIRRVHS